MWTPLQGNRPSWLCSALLPTAATAHLDFLWLSNVESRHMGQIHAHTEKDLLQTNNPLVNQLK